MKLDKIPNDSKEKFKENLYIWNDKIIELYV